MSDSMHGFWYWFSPALGPDVPTFAARYSPTAGSRESVHARKQAMRAIIRRRHDFPMGTNEAAMSSATPADRSKEPHPRSACLMDIARDLMG